MDQQPRPTPQERELAEYAGLMRRVYPLRSEQDRVVEAPTPPRQPRWMAWTQANQHAKEL